MPQKPSKYQIIYYQFTRFGWTVSDDVMGGIWAKMVKEGTLKKTFYGGKARTPGDFLEYFKNREKFVAVVFDGSEPVAIGWLSGILRTHAYAHFCTMKKVWGRESIVIGHQVVDWWLGLKRQDGTPIFDVLIGHTPDNNRLALRFIKLIGFKEVGTIPNMGYDAYAGRKVGITISVKEK